MGTKEGINVSDDGRITVPEDSCFRCFSPPFCQVWIDSPIGGVAASPSCWDFSVNRPNSVLVVSNSTSITPVLRCLLAEGLLVRLVGTAVDARKPSGHAPPLMVLLDDPTSDASTLRQCALLAEEFGVPVVVWSDALTESQRAAATLLGRCEVLPAGLDTIAVAEHIVERINEIARFETPKLASTSAVGFAPNGDLEITIDDSQRIVLVRGQRLRVTRTEIALLRALLNRPQTVWRRDELICAVWGPDWFGAANVLDTHILNLRTKLKSVGAKTEIRTIWGVGYSLSERALVESAAS